MTKGELEARILDGDRALVSAHGFPQFTRYSAACDQATTELADLIKARIG